MNRLSLDDFAFDAWVDDPRLSANEPRATLAASCSNASSASPRSPSRRSRLAAMCSAGRPTSRPRSRSSTPSSRTAATRSTPPTAIPIGCRGTGRRERNRHRPVAEAARPARRRRHRHEGRLVGEAQGAQARQHHRGLRGLAAAARGRDDRSLLVAPRRRANAARRYLGALDTLVKAGKVRAVGASNFGVARFDGGARGEQTEEARRRSSRSSPSTAC